MKSFSSGNTKDHKPSSSKRGRRLANSGTKKKPDNLDSAPAAITPPRETAANDPWGHLKGLLHTLEQKLVDPTIDRSSVDSSTVTDGTDAGTDKIATEILQALARQVQRDDQLLSKFRSASSDSESQTGSPDALTGQRVNIPTGVMPITSSGHRCAESWSLTRTISPLE